MGTELELNAEQARTLTDRIKIAVEGTWQLIREAYTSRAWAALGYDTWDAYCTAEFGQTRLALPREERREVVASLRESGLSTRAIASATGQSDWTVRDDLKRGARNLAPAPVTGTDGKTYTVAREPEPNVWIEPEPAEPPKPKRRPLPEAFTSAAVDLTKVTDRLARLTEDDRFPKNRPQTHRQVPELLGALDHLTTLVTAMNLPAADTSEEARHWWVTSLNKIADALHGVATSIEQEQ
jgi:hypothetical protein